MSAFFLYSQANRAQVKADNPEANFGDVVSENEVSKWCSVVRVRWG